MAVRKTKAGRVGGVEEARQLVALVATLTEPGDTLDAPMVAARLGVDGATAAKLLQIIRSSQTGDSSYLPIVDEDGEGLTLADHRGPNVTSGRRLRLTDAETRAVSDALVRLGVGPGDPLRQLIDDTLSSPGVDLEAMRRTLAPGASAEEAHSLGICAEALRDGRTLGFTYRKVHSTDVSTRQVAPLRTERRGNSWYLIATDLASGGERTFRMDHMSAVALGSAAPSSQEPQPAGQQSDGQMVGLVFGDPSYLDLLDWHGLVVEARSEGTVRAHIPWYGGDWLPRMVAACAGTASCDDARVMARAQELARELLG